MYDIENPVVRDELWNDHYCTDAEEGEEKIYIDAQVDASKFSNEDFYEIVDKVEELGHCDGDIFPESDYTVTYFGKEGDKYDTGFEIHGWANESVYEELVDVINDYGLKLSKIA